MSQITILGDADMKELFYSLSVEDLLELQAALADGLHTYSTGTQEQSACAANQPARTILHPSPGVSTLFMPASTTTATGVKIVTLNETVNEASPLHPSSPLKHPSVSSTESTSTSMSQLTLSSTHSSTKSTSSNSSTTAPSTPSTQTGVSTPQSSTSGSLPVLPTEKSFAASTQPRGTLTLLSPSGVPIALINATTLTAFRTALATTLLLRRRTHMHTLTVFGAGAQAYWHIRLALILRAPEIHHVNIITRNFHRAKEMLGELYRSESTNPTEPSPFPDPEHNPSWLQKVKFTILTPDYQDYTRLLREHVRAADAIFMCTPSPTPLFPHEHLTSTEGRRKGRFVAAIGSYKPHMCELHPEVLRAAVKPERGRHHHKHAANGGAIIVDTLEGAMRESGEVRDAGLKGEEMVEIGELVMLKRAMAKEGETEGGLIKWLQDGNVVYKSVGLGLMDIVVGSEAVKLAGERNMGTVISGF